VEEPNIKGSQEVEVDDDDDDDDDNHFLGR